MDGFFDLLHRFLPDLIGRTEGPMTFRFYLQPAMAVIAALGDGVRDAKSGRPAYLMNLFRYGDRAERVRLWQEGVRAVARILVLGVAMDVIYQFKVFGSFRSPLQTIVIVVALAFVPYLLLRGPIGRVAKWWLSR